MCGCRIVGGGLTEGGGIVGGGLTEGGGIVGGGLMVGVGAGWLTGGMGRLVGGGVCAEATEVMAMPARAKMWARRRARRSGSMREFMGRTLSP